jgi:hypothetical protein
MAGRSALQDEFTELPVSRQRKWQLRKRKEGRCEICGVPATSGRCQFHHISMALVQLQHRGETILPRRGKWLLLAGKRG